MKLSIDSTFMTVNIPGFLRGSLTGAPPRVN